MGTMEIAIAGLCILAAPEPPACTVDVGAVESGNWGAYPGHGNHPMLRRGFTLSSGVEIYRLVYSCCTDPSHAPEVATPEGYIGMPGPSSANWYHNGFLYIHVNGKDIGLTPLATLRKGASGGDRGTVELLWDRADVVVKAVFLVRPGDPALYLEVAAVGKKPVESLQVRFVAYPVEYTSNADRWAVTARRGLQQVRVEKLDPAAEHWVLCQDHLLSRKGTQAGGCGLAFRPAEIGEAVVHVTTYPVFVEARCRTGVHRARFAIWDFYNRSDDDARRYVEAVDSQTQKLLAELDFSNPRLAAEYWKTRRAEIAPLVAKIAASHAKLASEVGRHMAAADELHAAMAAQRAQGQPVPPATEQKLLDAIDHLDAAYWDLRLAALFADD